MRRHRLSLRRQAACRPRDDDAILAGHGAMLVSARQGVSHTGYILSRVGDDTRRRASAPRHKNIDYGYRRISKYSYASLFHGECRRQYAETVITGNFP